MIEKRRCACGAIAFTGALVKGVFSPLCTDHKKQYDLELTAEAKLEEAQKEIGRLMVELEASKRRNKELSANNVELTSRISGMERAMRERRYSK